MSDDELAAEQAAAITAVDIEAAPPDGEPVALVLFGTNQAAPVAVTIVVHEHKRLEGYQTTAVP